MYRRMASPRRICRRALPSLVAGMGDTGVAMISSAEALSPRFASSLIGESAGSSAYAVTAQTERAENEEREGARSHDVPFFGGERTPVRRARHPSSQELDQARPPRFAEEIEISAPIAALKILPSRQTRGRARQNSRRGGEKEKETRSKKSRDAADLFRIGGARSLSVRCQLRRRRRKARPTPRARSPTHPAHALRRAWREAHRTADAPSPPSCPPVPVVVVSSSPTGPTFVPPSEAFEPPSVAFVPPSPSPPDRRHRPGGAGFVGLERSSGQSAFRLRSGGKSRWSPRSPHYRPGRSGTAARLEISVTRRHRMSENLGERRRSPLDELLPELHGTEPVVLLREGALEAYRKTRAFCGVDEIAAHL